MLPAAGATRESDIAGLLARLYPVVRDRVTALADPWPSYVLFFSISDGSARAVVFSGTGTDFGTVWRRCARQVEQHARSAGIRKAWLRVDWVDAAEATNWRELRLRLARTKRNYFRHGISLDPRFRHAFLETEINANAMLYGGVAIAHCVVNEGHFRRYAASRHDLAAIDFADETPVWTFSTGGAFVSAEEEQAQLLGGAGRNAGRRVIERLTADDVFALVERGATYLAGQVGAQGRFRYGWHPCFGREIDAYNALRHASSLYAMIEAWELTRDEALKSAIDRGLGFLTGTLIQRFDLPGGQHAAFLVDEGAEIKLGGNAVCLLAIVRYSELTGDNRYRPLLDALAEGILWMQDSKTGSFAHVLHHPSLEVKEAFRIVYYDGEAAFGLMRLFAFTGNERWLHAVERAFAHFIRSDHWKAHDHWLSYCVNELTKVRPERAYFEFGIRNFDTHLDFVIERITTFPTLLELMMAAQQMLDRLATRPEGRDLLAEVDLAKFHRALHVRAHYMLNGHFWPELAMFFKRPADIAGSFFIRHHAFRVRIDDVEHYLSGYVAYWKHLAHAAPDGGRPDGSGRAAGDTNTRPGEWTAAEVAQATKGRWVAAPASEAWRATGLCIASPTFRPGNMVAVRSGDGRGIPASRLPLLPFAPQAFVTHAGDTDLPPDIPVLQVADIDKAILDLGAFARSRMTGRVIGVTGSAGKTTLVAMLGLLLRPWGEVGLSGHNANLPHGIAWNLASMSRSAFCVVVEMAIGRMQQSSLLARPHVALAMNVAAAHLEYHGSLEEVARRKARIFEGMEPGGIAIINRDMAEWALFAREAARRELRIVFYGRHEEAGFRLLSYDRAGRMADAAIAGRRVRFTCGAPGEHMAHNALACLAVLDSLGLPVDEALPLLDQFRAVDGRGAISDIRLGDRRIRLIDEAYNANPASMAAAMELMRDVEPPARPGRRVAVLGDMLELGPDSRRYHAALASAVEAATPDLVLLCGPDMTALRDALPSGLPCHWVRSADHLADKADGLLADGDLVLVKSSAGTQLSGLVDALKTGSLRS